MTLELFYTFLFIVFWKIVLLCEVCIVFFCILYSLICWMYKFFKGNVQNARAVYLNIWIKNIKKLQSIWNFELHFLWIRTVSALQWKTKQKIDDDQWNFFLSSTFLSLKNQCRGVSPPGRLDLFSIFRLLQADHYLPDSLWCHHCYLDFSFLGHHRATIWPHCEVSSLLVRY